MDSPGAPTRPTTVPAVVVLGSMVLGSIAAAWGINRRAAWLDEAISRVATTQLAETIDRTGGTMAGYYVLLDGWTELFGDSITVMRLLSLIFVAATVVVISRIAARLLEPSEAILATVLVALLPGLTRYGQEARSYALTALIASVSWLALIEAVRRSNEADGRRRATVWWATVAVLSVFGVLAHGLFILQVAAQGLSLLLCRRPDLYRFAPAGVLSLLTTAYLFSTGADYVANWVPPPSTGQVLDIGELLLSPSSLAALAILAVVIFGAITAVRRSATTTATEDRWLALVPLFWAVVPIVLLALLSLYRPYFLARYLVASLPAVALLLALGARGLAGQIGSRFEQTTRRSLLGATGAACIGLLLVGQVLVHQEVGDDWRGAARVLASNVEMTDAVLFTQPDLKLSMDTAWSELDQRELAAPNVIYPAFPLGVMHRFPDNIPVEELEHEIGVSSRLWIVHSTLIQSKDQLLDAVMELRVIVDNFGVAQRWHLDGDIQLVLLKRMER